jgi:hypothetical protein
VWRGTKWRNLESVQPRDFSATFFFAPPPDPHSSFEATSVEMTKRGFVQASVEMTKKICPLYFSSSVSSSPAPFIWFWNASPKIPQ